MRGGSRAVRVLQLKAENFLRLRAVDITPKGDVVKLSGKNGEGKTSTLDAIYAALDHRRLAATEPVHKGAKKALIKLDLGEIMVERIITAKSSVLKVTAADGTDIKSPQKFLDALVGELSFDPLAFDRMAPKEQVEMLRRAVKVDFDFAANAAARERTFCRRAELNRDAKQKRAQAEAMPAGGPKEPADEKAILDKMENAGKHNAELEARKQKRAALLQHAVANEGQAQRLTERIEELRHEIVKLGGERDTCEADAKTARERLANAPPLPEPLDVTVVRGELSRAQAHNAAYAAAQQRADIELQAEQLEEEARALTAALDALDTLKRTAIASAKLPVEGLDLGDDHVLYKGFPFAQASAAERLRVSMGIAMAANPKIRVIRISDASLLDSTSQDIVLQMARANDFQVWEEVVDETGKIGIVIEDGAVAAVNDG